VFFIWTMSCMKNKNSKNNLFIKSIYILLVYIIFLPLFVYFTYIVIGNQFSESSFSKKWLSLNSSYAFEQLDFNTIHIDDITNFQISYMKLYYFFILMMLLYILITISNNFLQYKYITKKSYIYDFILILIFQLLFSNYVNNKNIWFYFVLFSVSFLFNLFCVYSKILQDNKNDFIVSWKNKYKTYNHNMNVIKIDNYIKHWVPVLNIDTNKDEIEYMDLWKVVFEKDRVKDEKVNDSENIKKLDKMFGFN
jgi:hypothetical protein